MRDFALVARQPAHGPGKRLRVVPLGGAGGDEQLRHLLAVDVFLDRGVGGGAERAEQQQNLVALDQLARLLDGLRRRIGVVIGDEIDLAAIDAALVVDLLEHRAHRLADHTIGRRRAAIGHDVADLDLGVAGAGVVLLLRQCGGGARGHREAEQGGRDTASGQQRTFRKTPCSSAPMGIGAAASCGGAKPIPSA